MNVTTRPSTVADADAIEALGLEFQAYLRQLGDQAVFDFDAAAYRRDGFGDRPAFGGLVAETAGGAVVGYALYHDGYDTERGRRMLHLIDLCVREAFRRQGIGRALMQAVAAIGRERGAQVLFWSVYEPNALAWRFYERMGAREVSGLRWMSWDI